MIFLNHVPGSKLHRGPKKLGTRLGWLRSPAGRIACPQRRSGNIRHALARLRRTGGDHSSRRHRRTMTPVGFIQWEEPRAPVPRQPCLSIASSPIHGASTMSTANVTSGAKTPGTTAIKVRRLMVRLGCPVGIKFAVSPGSWWSDPAWLRSAARNSGRRSHREDVIGFRVARTLTLERN
jgi:hypothetical protein